MKFYSLASGSSGNSFLIDNGKELLLIDVGIPYKKIKEKIESLGYKIENIKYIFITHSHVDHIKAINSFSMDKVYSGSKVPGLKNKLEKNNIITLGTYKFICFPLSHDVECCGYKFIDENETLIYVTDTGYINSKIEEYFYDATYYVFESNHDIKMLMDSNRPSFLKSRILSDKGHLSNEIASEMIVKSIGEKTKEIYLAHISKDCNDENKALECLLREFKYQKKSPEKIKIKALKRDEILIGGNLYEINSSN